MFKKKDHSFEDLIIPPKNHLYGRKTYERYERFGKPIERSEKDPRYTADGHFIKDIIILFAKKKPDISHYTTLLEAAEWLDYGEKMYRINTLLSAEEIKKLLLDEPTLDTKNILVSDVRDFGFHY